MKTITSLLLASAVAISFTLAGSAKAGEAFLSPRAKANQSAHVSGVNTDRNMAGNWYAGAATRMLTTPPSMVASGPVKDINLAGANYVGASVKSPHRDLQGVAYQIAPLIEKRDAGQAK